MKVQDLKLKIIMVAPDGSTIGKTIHLKDVIKDEESIIEIFEPECTSGTCYTESQNHCDCGAILDQYTIQEVKTER